jgi:hypothetical protein
MFPTMQKTYTGGCHCGAVRFETDADIAAGTGKCNCSICAKGRLWIVIVTADALRLSAGEADLTDFNGRTAVAHHFFCRRCGIRLFYRVDTPNMRGRVYYGVNIACLDGVDVDELIAAPITYFDGLNNAWGSRPAEVRHL